MKHLSKKSSLLAAALTVSVILHVFLIAGISGIKGFGLLSALSNRLLLTTIISEPSDSGHKAKAQAGSRPLNKTKKPGTFKTPAEINTGPAGAEIKIKGDALEETSGGQWADNASASGEPAGNKENAADSAGGTGEQPDDRAEISIQSAILGDTTLLTRNIKESFSYDIYWVGIYIGNALFEIFIDNGTVKITSQAHSASFISTFYKVEDFAESRIVNGLPVNFRIRQHEGRFRSDKETIFDLGNNKITFMNYLNNTKDEHTTDKIMWDVISGFYYLRNQTLEPGKSVFVDVFDSNKFLKVEVNVLRREKIRVQGVGEINTVVVRLLLKSEGLFQSKGDIMIWLSDDAKRMPLRVETKAPIGNVVAELKSAETGR